MRIGDDDRTRARRVLAWSSLSPKIGADGGRTLPDPPTQQDYDDWAVYDRLWRSVRDVMCAKAKDRPVTAAEVTEELRILLAGN